MRVGRSAGRLSSVANGGDPETAVLRAVQGDEMMVHVIGAPGSDQMHLFTMGGIPFESDHYLRGRPDGEHPTGRRLSQALAIHAFGPWESFDAKVLTGLDDAGVPEGPLPGDYFVGDIRRPFTQAGLWGLARILDPAACVSSCPEPLTP